MANGIAGYASPNQAAMKNAKTNPLQGIKKQKMETDLKLAIAELKVREYKILNFAKFVHKDLMQTVL